MRETESVRMYADTLKQVRALARDQGRTLAGQLDRIIKCALLEMPIDK